MQHQWRHANTCALHCYPPRRNHSVNERLRGTPEPVCRCTACTRCGATLHRLVDAAVVRARRLRPTVDRVRRGRGPSPHRRRRFAGRRRSASRLGGCAATVPSLELADAGGGAPPMQLTSDSPSPSSSDGRRRVRRRVLVSARVPALMPTPSRRLEEPVPEPEPEPEPEPVLEDGGEVVARCTTHRRGDDSAHTG